MHHLRLFFILPMLISGGCEVISVEHSYNSTPHDMPTPLSLQNVTPLQVQRAGFMGLSGPMTAGPWKLTDISEGRWQHRCSYHWVSFDTIGSQSYAFTVSSQKNPLHAECEIKRSARFYRWNDEPEDSGKYSYLECKFHGSSEGTLHVDDTTPKGRREGRVTFGTLTWKVRSAHGEGSRMSGYPLGYEIVRGYTVVAAVETVAKHRVWMDPALSEEDQRRAMGIAGALLLYDPPGGFQDQECK
jgi:hypothetical protein